MDLQKIGKFLAQLRKEQELTQEQLGEKLGVTNKTVSRWENGNYLPPVEILQMLSDLYGLTINEILSGERLGEKEFKEKAEENIKSALKTSTCAFSARERQDYFRKKWLREHIGMITFEMMAFLALLIFCACMDEHVGFGVAVIFLYVRIANHKRDYLDYMDMKLGDVLGDACSCSQTTATPMTLEELKSKVRFYKKQWMRKELWINLLYALCSCAFLFAGCVQEGNFGLLLLGIVMGFGFLFMRMHAMRVYVDRHVYGETEE